MNNYEIAKKIKTVSNLNLTLAIISTIMAIPVLGYFLDFIFALPSIAVLVISIVGLVISNKVKAYVSRAGFILSLIASIMGISAVIAAMAFAVNSDLFDTASDFSAVGADASGALIFAAFSIIAWGLYIAACIVNYIGFSKNKKTALLAADESIIIDGMDNDNGPDVMFQ